MTTMKTWIALAALAALAGGCCQKEQNEVAQMRLRHNQLSKEAQDLRDQLNNCDARVNRLTSELETSRSAVVRQEAQIDALEAELTAKPAAAPAPAAAEGWTPTAVGDMVTLGSDILFSSGSAKLSGSGRQSLDRLVGDLRGQYAGRPIRVIGHTDGDPIRRSAKLWKDNLDLAANRAMAVTRHLRERGIDADRIETVSMGEQKPIAPNRTKAGKAKNRRVEIVVVRGS